MAVMVPIQDTLERFATELGKTFSDYKSLCNDNEIVQVVNHFGKSV